MKFAYFSSYGMAMVADALPPEFDIRGMRVPYGKMSLDSSLGLGRGRSWFIHVFGEASDLSILGIDSGGCSTTASFIGRV